MRIYNTLSRRKEEFKPFLEKARALYQCALNNIDRMINGTAECLYYWDENED